MKKILTLLFLTILFGCDKDDGYEINEIDSNPLEHAELGFELDEPDVLLNELAKGELKNQINSILLVMYGNTYRKWEFEYIDHTDILSKMIFYLPHYQGCEKNIYTFTHNEQNLIDKIISTRKNFCLEYEVIKTYTFNYNENGLLKSVFMDNEFFVEENYFGYYPNGKIKEIYNDHRGRGVDPSFNVQKFFYDNSFRNVERIEHTVNSNYLHIYEYSYDDKENPFKNVFIATSVFMPFIGPAHLSVNNVESITENRFSNTNDNEFTYPCDFQYSLTDNLILYQNTEDERVFYVNQ